MSFGYNTGVQLRDYYASLGYVFEDDWFAGDTLTGMIECGTLMSAADGVLDEEALGELADFVYGFTGGLTPAEDAIAIINGCLEALGEDGFDGRIAAVATYMPTHEACRLGIMVASTCMLADGDITEDELNMFYSLAYAMGIGRDDAEGIYASMEAAADGWW